MAQRQAPTDAQSEFVGDLDDVAEHVAWEYNSDKYEGPGTCGFAHIGNIDGRSAFVKRVKSVADSGHEGIQETRRGYTISISGLDLGLTKNHDSGYRLSINNVSDFQPGPSFQRIDVRERLHQLVLERLRKHGYVQDARVKSRMD